MRKVTLTFTVYSEAGQYVSRCPELGVASCGDTEAQALGMILDACGCYILSLCDVGEGEGEARLAEQGVL